MIQKETLFIGKSLLILEETDSTNAFLQRILKDNPVEGSVVWAHAQYAGKGQAASHWESEKNKNLTFSILLYPKFLNPSEIFYLNKITSLAIYKTLNVFLPHQKIQIKWPNDLYVNQKKIGGILIENNIDYRLNSSIIGIGLNVNQIQFSQWIDYKTTSLKKITNKEYELTTILQEICYRFEYYYQALKAHYWDSIDREYLQNLMGYQELGTYKVDNQEIQGTIIGVHKDGRLAVQHHQEVKNYFFKEIEFLI